ncbi:hypothetical protein [Bradyrhizobium sp. Ec3.3]|uniref:hypothetical protein n=1 Tax=Bradyrhizobium sp. Ec3.3 TaxID=189753 RepID=UPI00041B8808|nr:hypothetical protein [Bradyrhizobium sp. Ec3.3]
MALDLFGPTASAGGVTVRPTETRSFTATDTFFRDCSSPDLDDGTEFQAAWFNQALAALRAMARGNGQTAGAVDVVTQDNADDNILLKTIQHLIQRGQPLYGEDTSSTVNVITAALSPAPAEYKKGMTVAIKIANTNSGATKINLNGLGLVNVIRPDGSTPLDGDLPAGAVPALRYDGAAFQIIGADARPTLKRNTTIYVRTDGNDGNDGSANDSAHALATPQAAVNLAFKYGPSPFTMTIVIGAGTFTGGMITPFYLGPNIVVQGAGSGSTIFDGGASNYACAVQGPNTMTVSGIKCQSSSGPAGAALFSASYGATLTTNNTASGSCGGAVFQASRSGNVVVGNHTFSGNCYAAFWSNYAGIMQWTQGVTLTISAPITVSIAFAMAGAAGTMGVPSPAPTFSGAGNVTGPKYTCGGAAGIDSGGNGVNYFPGSSAGSTNNSGYYI